MSHSFSKDGCNFNLKTSKDVTEVFVGGKDVSA